MRRVVDDWRSTCPKRLLFRGQPENYLVPREVHNPLFLVEGVGEISLIFSLWRRMLARNPNGFVWFKNLLDLEWLKVLDSVFDLKEIERRKQAVAGENLAFYNWFDFEECGDPVLEGYAKCRLDLMMEGRFNLAGLLSTLLQHYGLYSPMLDLTESLDTAIFFASHQFHRTGNECTYEFVGTNSRKSVIYVFRENREMHDYERNESILQKLNPLRPIHQQCVVCTSSPYALNLPLDFLWGVILLEFDSHVRGSAATVDDLFPTDAQDAFLRGLKENSFAKPHLTDFAPLTKS